MKDDDADLERRIAIAHSRIRKAEAVKRQREQDIASGKLISRADFNRGNALIRSRFRELKAGVRQRRRDLASGKITRKEFEELCIGDIRQHETLIVELAKMVAAKCGLSWRDVAASLRGDVEASERALRKVREMK
jgi:hypothetical protein